MNDDQSKRLADAADATLNAAEALEDARDSLSDRRFDSEQERDRTQAIQQTVNKLDAAAKRIEDALRKGIVASAALDRRGLYERYCSTSSTIREARSKSRSAPDQDGTPARKERAQESLAKLETAMTAVAGVVFGE